MSSSALKANRLDWDRIGCWTSTACAVHCFLAPVVLIGLPSVAGFWTNPGSHVLMAIGVIGLALISLMPGYRKHKSRFVLGSAGLGVLLILVGSALPYLSGAALPFMANEVGDCTDCCPVLLTDAVGATSLHLPPAAIVTLLGSLVMVVAHLANRRSCSPCQ